VPFEFFPAFAAGLVGGLVMSALSMGMKAMGAPLAMDIHRIWGTMVKMQGTGAIVAGFIIHLIVSGIVGLIYAAFFDWLGLDNNLWLWGLLGGVVHWVIGGLFLAMLPAVHPDIPGREPEPGPFASRFGRMAIGAFMMAHLVYGLLFGILYGFWHSAGGSEIAF
jgi:hypothetical protein